MDIKKVLLVAKKDLKIEFRSRQTINFMFLFSFISLVMFNFGADPFSESLRDVAPSLLWFVFIFAGMLGLSRAFIKEKDAGTLEGMKLSPLSVDEILLGKIIYNLVLMLLIEFIGLFLFIPLFNYNIASIINTIAVMTLGIAGIVIVGSFVSAVILGARSRELLLLVIVLPLLIPVIVPTIIALRKAAIYAVPLIEIGEIKLSVIYIIIMSTLSLILFEYVLEE